MKRTSVFVMLLFVLLFGLGGSVYPVYAVAGSILPFNVGTTATFGIAGVHDCGFGTNWKAVDFFPAENMVYSSEDATIDYVCRDENQVSIKMGDHLYAHLQDVGQEIGDFYSQGQQIAPMVYGTLNSECGNTDQLQSNYHVHYCFIPNGNFFDADNYNLHIDTEEWMYVDSVGMSVVHVGGTLTANWKGSRTTVGGKPMVNIWDLILNITMPQVLKVVDWLMPPDTSPDSIKNFINFASGIQQSVFLVAELVGGSLEFFNWNLLIVAVNIKITFLLGKIGISTVMFIGGLLQKGKFW